MSGDGKGHRLVVPDVAFTPVLFGRDTHALEGGDDGAHIKAYHGTLTVTILYISDLPATGEVHPFCLLRVENNKALTKPVLSRDAETKRFVFEQALTFKVTQHSSAVHLSVASDATTDQPLIGHCLIPIVGLQDGKDLEATYALSAEGAVALGGATPTTESSPTKQQKSASQTPQIRLRLRLQSDEMSESFRIPQPDEDDEDEELEAEEAVNELSPAPSGDGHAKPGAAGPKTPSLLGRLQQLREASTSSMSSRKDSLTNNSSKSIRPRATEGKFQGGRAHVTVVGARSVKAREHLVGTVNPYCVLVLDDELEQRTRVVKRTTDPEWNQELVFSVGREEAVLTVMMWDDNRPWRKPDFLGRVRVELAPIARDLAIAVSDTQQQFFVNYDEWLPLGKRSAKDKVGGDLRLRIRYSFVRSGAASPKLRPRGGSKEPGQGSLPPPVSPDYVRLQTILGRYEASAPTTAAQEPARDKLDAYRRALESVAFPVSPQSEYYLQYSSVFSANDLYRLIRAAFAVPEVFHRKAVESVKDVTSKESVLTKLREVRRMIAADTHPYYLAAAFDEAADYQSLKAEQLENFDCLVHDLVFRRDFMGTVKVTVVEAQELLGKDFWGNSDPYAVLKLEGKEFRSPTLENNLNPRFNYTAEFEVTHPSAQLELTLWDDDFGRSKDDFLGRVFVDIATLPDTGQEQDKWFTLQKRSKRSHVRGRVRLRLSLTIKELETIQQLEEKSSSSPFQSIKGDFFAQGAQMTPASGGTAKGTMGRGTIRRRFRSSVRGAKFYNDMVETMKQDSLLDAAEMVPPTPPSAKSRRPTFFGGSRKSASSRAASPGPEAAGRKDSGGAGGTAPTTLATTIMRGRNLLAADWNGKSDPYCQLTLSARRFSDGKNTVTTVRTTVKPETLEPEWMETFFFDLHRGFSYMLEIRVYDKDRIGRPDFLGKISVAIGELNQEGTLQQWYRLQDVDKQSELLVKFQFLKPEVPSKKVYVEEFKVTGHHLSMSLLVNALLYVETFDPSSSQTSSSSEVVVQRPTPASSWLLEEFGLRHGIAETHRLVLVVQALAKFFEWVDVDADYLMEEIGTVKELMQQGAILSKHEKALIEASMKGLRQQIRTRLVNFKATFPRNIPADGIPNLIEVLKLVGDLEGSALVSSLVQYVTIGINDTYQRLVASMELPPAMLGEESLSAVHPAQLKQVVEAVIDEVGEVALFFRDAFPSEVHLVQLVAKTYYRLIRDDTLDICSQEPKWSLTSDAFALMLKMRELHTVLAAQGVSDPELILDLPFEFRAYVTCWLDKLTPLLCHWAVEACRLDSWQPVGKLTKHSSSLVDVFSACTQGLDFLTSLHFRDVGVVSRYVHCLSATIQRYSQALQQNCLYTVQPETYRRRGTDRPGTPDVDEDGKRDDAPSSGGKGRAKSVAPVMVGPPKGVENADFQFSARLCVQLNNIQASRLQWEALHVDMEEYLDTLASAETDDALGIESARAQIEKCVADTGSFVTQILEGLTDKICRVMQPSVEWYLGEAFKPPINDLSSGAVNKKLDHLLTYLDKQLGLVFEQTYRKVILRVLHSLWAVMVDAVEAAFLPMPKASGKAAVKSMVFDPLRAYYCEAVVKELAVYFMADGHGVSEKFIHRTTRRLEALENAYSDPVSKNLMDRVAGAPLVGDADRPEALTKADLVAVLSFRPGEPAVKKFVQETMQDRRVFPDADAAGGAGGAGLEPPSAPSKWRRRLSGPPRPSSPAAGSGDGSEGGDGSGMADEDEDEDYDKRLQSLGLPADEIVLGKFNCVNSKMMHGFLLVCSRHVCFDTVLFGSRAAVILPIKRIAAVAKTRFAKFFDNAIEFTMVDSGTHYFGGFSNRGAAYQLVCQAGETQGRYLDTLVEAEAKLATAPMALGAAAGGRSGGGRKRATKDDDIVKEAEKRIPFVV